MEEVDQQLTISAKELQLADNEEEEADNKVGVLCRFVVHCPGDFREVAGKGTEDLPKVGANKVGSLRHGLGLNEDGHFITVGSSIRFNLDVIMSMKPVRGLERQRNGPEREI